jgi:hypothetical protein
MAVASLLVQQSTMNAMSAYRNHLVLALTGYLSICSAFTALSTRRAVSQLQTTSSPRTSSCLFATWSDIKAVRDYQDFLSSGQQKIELSKDRPSVIVMPSDGISELGEALKNIGMGDDLVVTPGSELPASLGDGSTEYPIYITLPPWQLTDFLKSLPESYKERAEDFVFFSGGLSYGNVEDVLKERGELVYRYAQTKLE